MAENTECSICTEFYSTELNDQFCVTECSHMFHKSCLNSSLACQPSCPICRKSISNLATIRPILGMDPTRKPRKFTITTLGDAGVGKTGLIRRFADGTFNPIKLVPTLGVNFKTVSIEVGGDPVKLSIQDTGGDYRYKSVTPQYIRNSHGIVIAYDCHRWSTLQNVQEWLDFANEHAPEAEKVLIGCRSDLENCDTCKNSGHLCRKATAEEIEAIVLSFGLFHVTTSAKTAYCVDIAFRTLAFRIMENDRLLRQRNNNVETIKLHDNANDDVKVKVDNCCGKVTKFFEKLFGYEVEEKTEVALNSVSN